MKFNTLVYIETNNNTIEKVSKEIIAHARQCFKDNEICGVVVTDEITTILEQFKNAGLDKLFVIQNPLLKKFNVSAYCDVLSQLINDIKPSVFLMGATANGRELAPRIASKLEIGLTADCTDLQLDENNNLLATRPTYGGKMMATIISKTTPNFATVRQGAFKHKQFDVNNTEVCSYTPEMSCLNLFLSQIEVLKTEIKEPKEDWTESEIIVAGGLGLKSKENFELIYKFSDLIGAKPAASRAAVELGWAPHDIQVGQTGKSVAPKLYIALGISGALQHISGINNAQKIVAINTDNNSPIMNIADFAIQSDAVDVLNNLINKLSN